MSRASGGIPALYIVLFSYVAGLFLYHSDPLLFWCGAAFVPLYALFCGFVLHEPVYRKSLILCWLVFLSAGVRVEADNPRYQSEHYINTAREGVFCGRLEENPREREKTFRATVVLEAVWRDSVRLPCKGRVVVYFPKRAFDTLLPPVFGDRLWFCAELKPIEGFTGEDGKYFDYAEFMARRGIYAQCFLRDEGWRTLPWRCAGVWDFIRKKTLDLRMRLSRFFDGSGMAASELSVAKALVLGEKTQDPVQQAYRDTGIVHILAVSGMHLSIFALLAVRLLSFLGRRRGRGWLRFAAVNLTVWGYAMLTGLSPSVCRAACMFTFVGLGSCLNRSVKTERSLAVSALIQLSVNPMLLYETGFLLSYSAVLGLVFLCPLLMRAVKTENRILKWVWGLVAASCSAQAATLPFILHSFGTFPTYFLLSNLLVTPIVTIALPLGFFTAAMACFWHTGALWAAKVFNLLLLLMNKTALFIGSWRAALLTIPLSVFSSLLLYGAIYNLYRVFRYKSRRNVPASILLLTLVIFIG